MAMLDFILEFERVLKQWPEGNNWSITQIADYTGSSIPQVVDILSDVLNREIEVHENLSLQDAAHGLKILKERMQHQLIARQRRIEAHREKAVKAYDMAMEKARVLQMTKNWRNAYKTLSYYAGRYEKDLPEELLLSLCNECIRLGIKSDANMQELSQWLRKGVAACVKNPSPEAIEDAMDFIEAYSDHFKEGAPDGGRNLLGSVLGYLRDPVINFNLMTQYDTLLKEINIS
jgi:hypothetical protein